MSTLASNSRTSPTARAWARFLGNRTAVVSAVLLVLLITAVTTASWWLPHDPNRLSENQFSPPSRDHWLGTDANGRDLLARICAGTRVSMTVGIAGAAVSLVIGSLWGAIAGYLGG